MTAVCPQPVSLKDSQIYNKYWTHVRVMRTEHSSYSIVPQGGEGDEGRVVVGGREAES